ncbi:MULTISPECIES: MFS transporter [unclassified Cryobacterium]|uniref:MFS transporter n=1 Tax=unclassified Cryobacterium TaxID=2649013 RepID=UPI001069E651|nr:MULTISPECIES: MFS transporter [unclassified Cryobacterium]MDY7527312.1 MFS transporter [Cryobacterium sp. 10C2]MDY7556903.1 MFS transporter [Cryobacterium sp. 10C3]MEB0003894.1 MFS transporter [Cryobacterium sp. RTC2.1]MEB0202718.1 MFS transporter [Cryobacterium sp. 5I3]MEB0285818.1 MFS transporter [Cryobacterium sp. 10S3]
MTKLSMEADSSALVEPKSVKIRWFFIALLVLGGIVNYLDRGTLSIANTTIAAEFHLNAIEMGLLLSAFAWPYAIANLPAGYLVDKFGPKRMYAWAAIAWSVVSMATALANSFTFIYVMRMALGISESPFFTSGLKVSDRWFNKTERALPVSIVNTGSQIANAIAPPLLTFLLLTMSWRGMFVMVGALGIVVAAIWIKIYRDPTAMEEIRIKGAALHEENHPKDKQVGWGDLLKHRNTWFMIIGAFGIFYTVWVYLTWLPSYLQTARGFSLSQTGWLAALPFLCGIIGVLAGGIISGKAIKRGIPTIRARKIPIVGGALLAAVAVLPVAYVDNTPLAITLLCIGYFAAQVPIGVIWTLAADLAEKNQVASLGAIQNFGGFLGAALAPIVTGYILNATGGNYTLVFVIGGIMLLVGALSYGFFVKDRRPRITA